jgi:L-ribulose-5-phosphate 3-epimerase
MTNINRRSFLNSSVAVAAAAGTGRLWASPLPASSPQGMRLGLIVGVEKDADQALKQVHDLGIPTCQAQTDDYSDRTLNALKSAAQKYGVEVTAINSSGGPPNVYDFYQGPLTIGVVPKKYRQQRIDNFKRASDFARKLNVPAFHTHYGFIPENPNDPAYPEVVEALRQVATHLKGNGQMMLYETGQETPITMLRAITDVGLDNQFVNLDTANLILYGKANPLDALDVIGKHVRGLHAKDGFYPTDPKQLGREVPIGQGKVDFPRIIRRLKALNYRGPITIEREISGPQQVEDIKKSKAYLEKLIG